MEQSQSFLKQKALSVCCCFHHFQFKKVFTIQGGYSTIRNSLRRRGWVEKFYKIPVPQKKTAQVKKPKGSDDDDNDFDDDDGDDDDDDVDSKFVSDM